MYKKILTLVMVMVAAINLSGCIKSSTNIEVTKRDSVIVTQIKGIDNNALKLLNFDYTSGDILKSLKEDKNIEKDLEGFQKRKYYISNYKDEVFSGIELKKTYKKASFFSAQELPDGFLLATEAKLPVEIKKSPFGAKYSIHLKFDPAELSKKNNKRLSRQSEVKQRIIREIFNIGDDNSDNSEQINTEEPTQEAQDKPAQETSDKPDYKSMIDLTIKIPKKAKEHNAKSFNNKTHEYKWELSEKNPTEIILKYERTNFLSILFVILVIAAMLVVINKNKQYSKKDNDETKSAF